MLPAAALLVHSAAASKPHRSSPLIRYPLFALALMLLPLSVVSATDDQPDPIAIEKVLALGPLPIDAELLDKAGHADSVRRALVGQLGEGAMPRAGNAVTAFGKSMAWRTLSPGEADPERRMQLLWFQLETGRFVRGHLKVDGLRNSAVFVEGKKVDGDSEGHALDLRNGSHGVWIVHEGAAEDVEPKLAWQGRSEVDRAEANIQSRRRVSAQRLTNAETVAAWPSRRT